MKNIVGAPDERLEDRELRIAELEDQCERQAKMLQKLQQEGVYGGTDKFPKRSKDEQEQMIKELTKSNAMLRRKLDDANVKITTLQK